MNCWNSYLINTEGLPAGNAQKVNMIIVMMASLTILFTESIQNGIVGCGYLMDEPVF